jgi:hypothetical protein
VTTISPALKIDWATHEAAKYACENWHYSRCLPAGKLVKIGVWENTKFIGVVVFSGGPSPNIWKTFRLTPLEGAELSRVALTKHETSVSRIVSIAIKFLRKFCPKLRLIVSYADTNEGHHGGIYQAGNWLYCGEFGPKVERYLYGQKIHERNMRQRILDGKNRRSDFTEEKVKPKHKYLMPLDIEMARQVQAIRKPYPKRAGSKANVASAFHAEEGGATPTPALHLNEVTDG